jgi:hypothetical protein
MATDINAVLENLMSFYDFSKKSVVHVGAGGGQFIGYAPVARSVIAVDSDSTAVDHLKAAIEQMKMQNLFTVIHGDFLSISNQADVVFFEFCLHEMTQPEQVLIYAKTLAPEILVLDHLPDSQWAWYTCETEKAERSWAALRSMPIVRMANFKALQLFDDHAQLQERIKPLGPPAIDRASVLVGQQNIEIKMTYAAALVEGGTK